MPEDVSYPGTAQHQTLLRAIIDHYQLDPRILAIAVFGSLGRGNWDQYSDLDLDLVITDSAQIDMNHEIQQLGAVFAALHNPLLCCDYDGSEAVDMVLHSLMENSIRFHPLATTSPEIVDTARILSSQIPLETIVAAGRAHGRRETEVTSGGVDQFLRLAVGVDVALQRRHFWRAVQCLQLMRGLVLGAFALTRGGWRPFYYFQEHASAALQARVGATLPQYSLRSVQTALQQMLDLVEGDLAVLSNGQLHLSATQRALIGQIRKRQVGLVLTDERSG
jgi:predicted nucleotidyltransferase